MRKISAPGPYHAGSSAGGGVKSSLKKQSSFDLSHRKISTAEAPPRRPRISVFGEPSRRISHSSPGKEQTLLALSHRYTSAAFDASEFRRAYLESHFNENEITTVSATPRSKKPVFAPPSQEASSKFRKKLRTKAEAEQGRLLEKLNKLSFEGHQLQARTEEALQRGSEEGNPLEDSKSNIQNFCLTTFKILTLVNECYELVKSIQTATGGNGSSSTSSSSSNLSPSGNLLSESFRNHDFAKDISVSYFGLDWNELRSLIQGLESQVTSLCTSSRKNSIETNLGHYYGHMYNSSSSYHGGSSEHSNSDCGSLSPQALCVSICKDLRKLRDDVLSHTEAVLRGRLSPVNKQIISEEQNRLRAYTMINSLLSHSHQPLQRKGSFTNKLLSLFHPSKKKAQQQTRQNQQGSDNDVWAEWFEVACNQTELLKKIQEI